MRSFVPPGPVAKTVLGTALVLLVFYATAFFELFRAGIWLIGPDGRPAAVDYVNVWAAGDLALQGRPGDAYDWDRHGEVERRVLGPSFDGYFGFHYPPHLLPLAAAAALLPFVPSLIVWIGATGAAYLAAMRAVLPVRGVALAAAAFPATAYNVQLGQNGLLSAALLAAGLALLDRRPVLAGMLFGALTYKPHLGMLLPFALAAGGHGRAFMSAATTALALLLATFLLYGAEPFTAFAASLEVTNGRLFVEGQVAFAKLQTLYGVLRHAGLDHRTALAAHGATTALVLVLVVHAWRRPGATDAKCAALAAGALLATPYAFIYDFTLLAVAIAFLVRGMTADRRDPLAIAAIGAAVALVFIAPFAIGVPGIGAVAAAVILAASLRAARASPSDVALQKLS